MLKHVVVRQSTKEYAKVISYNILPSFINIAQKEIIEVQIDTADENNTKNKNEPGTKSSSIITQYYGNSLKGRYIEHVVIHLLRTALC